MRPADRLFHTVQLIRGRRLTTAKWLAERLGLSERTIYRDIAQLQAQGVPIEGEAGVGYRLGKGFDLPPLMFTLEEARALVAAVRVAQTWLDPALALASETALSRVLSVLPAHMREQARGVGVIAPPVGLPEGERELLQLLRSAASAQQKVRIEYRDAAELRTTRTVRPLAVFYWGKVWTFAGWCEQRQNFRQFRVDRIENLAVLNEHFAAEPGKTLADLLRLPDVPEALRVQMALG